MLQKKTKLKFKKLPKKVAAVGILLILFTGLFNNSVDFADHQFNSNTEIEKNQVFTEPVNSDPDFTDANKTITKGVQDNPPFNETNIQFDDEIYDTTNFSAGSNITQSYFDASAALLAFGAWGTTAGGENDHAGISLALESFDGNQFWLWSTYSIHYPLFYPIMSLACGGFSFINDPDILPQINRVRIEYVTQTSFATYTGNSQDLLMSVHLLGGAEKWFMVDQNPTHAEINSGVFTITDEDFLDLVRNGDYVFKIAVWMDCSTETSPWTYIGIDNLLIHYDYQSYDVDFTYKLNYGSHNLSTLQEFEMLLDINGTIEKPDWLNISLYNFNTTKWDQIGQIINTGSWNKTIDSNASAYFNNESEILIRFQKYNYTEASPPLNYQIKVDMLKINIDVPDPPQNFYAESAISHIFLTWDVPNDYGVNITQYNIYRGEYQGWFKELIGTPTTNEFNDTTPIIGTRYYYVVSAENSIGESENSTEETGVAYNTPFVEWKSPIDNDTIIFEVGVLANFSFRYDRGGVDNVTLDVNGIDFGCVFNETSVIISPYTVDVDGNVNITLHGYQLGVEVVNATIHCFFSKLILDVYELLEQNSEYIGNQLYLILHDPGGDNSYSFYDKTAKVSMAVGLEVSQSSSLAFIIGDLMKLDPTDALGIKVGGTTSLKFGEETVEGFDFRFDFTETTMLTSNKDSQNKDYIGPGYGDRYWGEAWTITWRLKAYHRAYFNGSDRYEEPNMFYGVIREAEVLISDVDAPEDWKNLNPVHNGWQNVKWLDKNKVISGGSPFTKTHEISSCYTQTQSLEFFFSEETYIKLPYFGNKQTFDFSMKVYSEQSLTDSYRIGYQIYDDEPTDTLVQDCGIDLTFGTFIFKTNGSMSKTSYPLEHDTFDYLPPIIEFPNIELDSSQDGIAPCNDDSPLITAEIFDEGGIRSALVFFSINDGANWDSTFLYEQVANPGTWQATIPSYPHGTTVTWYIKVWDLEGSYSNRTDPNGKSYKYTVINRPPRVTILDPIGGEVFQDIVNIEWRGSDPDGDSLTYSLAYNLDNTGWHLITSGLSNTSYNWNASTIASNNVLLKVIVNDGDIQVEDIMDFVFTINPQNILKQLHIQIINQLFSTEEFNTTFYISDNIGYGIDSATIQLWWNGTDVSGDVQNLGNGYYFISLDAILVNPDDDPIPLEITVNAPTYQELNYQMEIAVDPESVKKRVTPTTEGDLPILISVIISVSLGGIVAAAGIYMYLKKRSK